MSRIVLASDLSDRSALATGRAVLLARSLQTALTVLHVGESADPGAVAHVQDSLDRMLACAGAGDLDVRRTVLQGDVCDLVVRAARTADLLILGEPRRQTLREFFTGSTAHRIMTRVSTPGLMVRTPATGPYRRTVFAVDFSAGSLRAIQAAVGLGLGSGQCAAVHVHDLPQVDLMVQASSYSMADIRQQISTETARIEKRLHRLMKRSGLSGRTAAIHGSSSPADSLLAFAGAFGADLIVLGSRGRSRIARIALGSVAEATLANAPCDVLLVPPAPHSAGGSHDG